MIAAGLLDTSALHGVSLGLNGHRLEDDPPFHAGSVDRLTCVECGMAVLVPRGRVRPYGSATENRCPEGS